MKELLDKISSYNIFNYLLPGILYAVLLSEFSEVDIIQEEIIVGAFLYYFIGLVISRIGSLIVEPIFKKMKFLKFAEYSEFITACEKDTKLETLSESNNMYRTLIALFLSLLFSKLYVFLAVKFEWSVNTAFYILAVLLLTMFIFAYRKQTNYITNRIRHHIKKMTNNGKSL